MFKPEDIELAETIASRLNIRLDKEVDRSDVDQTLTFDGMICVTALAEPANPHQTYVISEVTIIPGVYRTANGDGWPDEADLADLGEAPTFQQAFMYALEVLIQRHVQMALDTQAETKALEGQETEENV